MQHRRELSIGFGPLMKLRELFEDGRGGERGSKDDVINICIGNTMGRHQLINRPRESTGVLDAIDSLG